VPLSSAAHLDRKITPRAPARPRQMTRMFREEKQSARIVRPKTFRAKAIKKGAAKLKKAFLGKEKHMRFAATVEDSTNKGKNSPIGLVQSRGKFLPTDTQKLFRAIVNGV
jgi:hypothetical protein